MIELIRPLASQHITDCTIMNIENIDPDWPVVVRFNNLPTMLEIVKYSTDLLGYGASRDKNGNTSNDDDHSAKWAIGTGTRIYWKSDYYMKLCCMQLLLSEW